MTAYRRRPLATSGDVLHVLELAIEGESRVNLWMKRVLGAAAVGGGLLALSAGAAGAQEVSAEVRVCADDRVLSGLLGSCRGSGTSVTARAGRATAPPASGSGPGCPAPPWPTSRSGPGAAGPPAAPARPRRRGPRSLRAEVDASAATSPRARADASASLTRRTRPLLGLDATVSLAGVGLLGSTLFTLVGDELTLDLLMLLAFALLVVGVLAVRATRPAAATEGDDER